MSAVFAVVAVLSASGNVPGVNQGSSSVDRGRTYRAEDVLGTRGHDIVEGTPAGNPVFTFGGDDRVYGGDGNDLIDPGNGEDGVYAGAGDDRIRAFDGSRDSVHCGDGIDIAYVDSSDRTFDCEELMESRDYTSPATPDPPETNEVANGRTVGKPLVTGTVVLDDETWSCEGPVDVDLVKVRISAKRAGLDAVSLGQRCTGRIGRIEVDTWSGDGVKVLNAGTVAHDVVIESGIVRCHAKTPGYHQDGIQVMGGDHITFRNLEVNCGGPGVNAAFFVAQGGQGASLPTDIVLENSRLGTGAAHTILLADSARSGVRNTLICHGRYSGYRIRGHAVDPITDRNRTVAATNPNCQTQ